MKYSRNSLLLTAGLFSIAAAIVFHAWWPSYKVEQYVADCIAPAVAKVNEATAALEKAKADPNVGLIPLRNITDLEQAEKELPETRQRCIKEANLLYQ